MKEQDLINRFIPHSAEGFSKITEKFHLDKCVQITLDYAREEVLVFNEWKEKNNYWYSKDNKCFFKYGGNKTKYSTLELYEIYLTTKTK